MELLQQLDLEYRWGVRREDERPARRIAEVIGERVRAIRQGADVRQGRVAEIARRLGLTWARTSVATIKAGRRDVSLEELVLLPLIMSVACQRPVLATELLPDSVALALTPVVHVPGATALALLRDQLREDLRHAKAIAELLGVDLPDAPPLPHNVEARWPDLDDRTEQRLMGWVAQEADSKAAKRLGVPALHVATAPSLSGGEA